MYIDWMTTSPAVIIIDESESPESSTNQWSLSFLSLLLLLLLPFFFSHSSRFFPSRGKKGRIRSSGVYSRSHAIVAVGIKSVNGRSSSIRITDVNNEDPYSFCIITAAAGAVKSMATSV